MRKFDYSFLNDSLIPSYILNLIVGISELKVKTNYRKKEHTNIFSNLEKVSKLHSIKSSNEIEGIKTTNDRIISIVNSNALPINHNEAEIVGYRDALNSVHSDYNSITFSEEDILTLHKTIYYKINHDFGGYYKTQNNVIVEYDAERNRKIKFSPIPADQVKEAMQNLIEAYNAAILNPNINPLLLIPCVILDFLCIHPFTDGNGRVSRLLSLLLLYQNGYDVGKYISFEEEINKYVELYYSSLQLSSKNWHSNENTYLPFIGNFLTTLYSCYNELDNRFTIISGNKLSKQNRIKSLILNSSQPISKYEICEKLPDISPTTVEMVLGNLVKNKLIQKIGNGRSTKYIRSN